ncbi:hypothetical protein SAMN04488580_110103 [Mycobacterium sp. 283mftsu]|nr:hypothetical protein SAMN04488580_110103 [Mycobacterium sp. 283mftsu]
MVGCADDRPIWCACRASGESLRYGPHHQAVLQWLHFGLDAVELAQMLTEIEASHWSGAPTGWVDESMQAFDENEIVIAKQLAAEGHNVIALPVSRVDGTASADAIVSGTLVEFKTYFGCEARGLFRKIAEARRQADRIVIRAVNLAMSDEVRQVLDLIGARGVRRQLYGARVVGSGFDWEWGDWNPQVPADRWLLRQWAGLTTPARR